MRREWSSLLLPLVAMLPLIQSSHFRGGTIHWKAEGGRKVHFSFALGWTYRKPSGCDETKIGELITSGSTSHNWICWQGCPNQPVLKNMDWYCAAANQNEDWRQGRNNFTHIFQNDGPFIVRYGSLPTETWIKPSNHNETGPWSLTTTVILGERSDTGQVNSSPKSSSKPVYRVQFGCQNRMQIPVVDPDGDRIRCRWAKGKVECGSICGGLPGAVLDEENCELTFNTTTDKGYVFSGTYAVAIMIEDFPRSSITIGASLRKTPRDAMSSISLQFLVETSTPPKAGIAECVTFPRFVAPTPEVKEVQRIEEGHGIQIDLVVDSGNDTILTTDDVSVSGPITSTLAAVTQDLNRTNIFHANWTWYSSHADVGFHIVCATANNAKRGSGDQRCFTIEVVPLGCISSPCLNNGTCNFVNGTGNVSCICRPGFTGQFCENAIPTTTIPSTLSTTTPTTTTTTAAAPPIRKNKSLRENYKDCDCRIKQGAKAGRGKQSRWARDALTFGFGVPLGLGLSVITSMLYTWWRQTRERKKKHRHQRPPHPRPDALTMLRTPSW